MTPWKDKGLFDVLAINSDDDRETIARYVESSRLDVPDRSGPRGAAGLSASPPPIASNLFPTNVLIDGEGQVVFRRTGWDEAGLRAAPRSWASDQAVHPNSPGIADPFHPPLKRAVATQSPLSHVNLARERGGPSHVRYSLLHRSASTASMGRASRTWSRPPHPASPRTVRVIQFLQ